MAVPGSSAANKDFFEFVKAIGESKSKQEEDHIITEEILSLKRKLTETNIPKKKMKEILARALYVEMLGQDASFLYIKSVEMCASSSISQKRMGYLTASLFLSPDHEFRFMLVNQIQRDLHSSNILENCTALIAVRKIVTVDMIPAVLNDVLKMISHEQELVRKHCLCALHRLYQMDSSCLVGHADKIRLALCDRDPSVMGASLVVIYAFALNDASFFKDLVPSFVSILKQVVEHRLPRDFDYHRIPAPWIQIQLLQLLALLGRGDQASSEGMYEVLVEVMRRADVGINIGYAIVYECVRTITAIYPNSMLLDAAATSISRFVRSDSHNLKYIGIKGLAAIVKDHPRYAVDHQMAVIDCLEDPDETLKRKTLDLLLKMTNAVNVEFIVAKLLSFLSATSDDHFKGDLVGRITQCAERYAPSNTWYVETMVRVFELAGEKVKPSVAQTLMQLIAEGVDGEDDDEEEKGENGLSRNDEVRLNAVDNFLILLEKPKLPDIIAQTVAWVLGEYGYLSQTFSKEEVMEKLRMLAVHSSDASTKAHIITALMKLCAQNGACPPKVTYFVNQLARSIEIDVQQRCLEFKALVLKSDVMVDALPVDASCEDIEVDERLSFLSGYVQRALARGAVPYTPPVNVDDDDDDEGSNMTNALKVTPYERQTAPAPPPSILGGGTAIDVNAMSAMLSGAPSSAPVMSTPVATQGNQLLNTKSSGPWGKKPEPMAAPTPAATALPVQSARAPSPVVMQESVSMQSSQSQAQTAYSAPAAPRQPTEREKMAAALFGGVGAAKPSAPKKKSNPTAPSAAAASGSSLLDIADSPIPPAGTPSSSSSNQSVFDLLSTATTASPMPPQAPTPSQTAPPAPASFGSGDLLSLGSLDLLKPTPLAPMSPTMMMPAVTAVVAPPATVGINNISNAFVDMTLSASSAAPSLNFTPLRMNTRDFGARWGSLTNEVKQTVSCRCRTLQELQGCLSSFLFHVESIPSTNEAIYAGSEGVSGASLLHLKLFAARMSLDITVRGTSKDNSNALLSAVSNAFK